MFAAIVAGVIISVASPFAQAQPGNSGKENLKAHLTDEQKAMLAANKASIAETRAAFKASLTQEQKEMLQNNSLTLEQKRANLRASLNSQQQQMLIENRQMRQMQRQSFRNSLTVQQKQFMKKVYMQKMRRTDPRPGLRRLPLRYYHR